MGGRFIGNPDEQISSPIRWVIDAIGPSNGLHLTGVDPVYGPQIDAILVRVGTPLVVRINPAGLAKIVFRRVGVPLIKRQVVRPLNDP